MEKTGRKKRIGKQVALIKRIWKEKSPEKIFLSIAIPIVGLLIVTIPALQGWDEATHFLRAYQVSDLDFNPDRFGDHNAGDKTPVDIVQLHDAAVSDLILSAQTNLERKVHPGFYLTFLKDNSPSDMTVNKFFEGSAVYSPVSYIPQSMGIFIARNLHLPLLTYIYLGRLLNAVLFILIVYFAIKLSPRGKWVIFAIGLLPTSITTAATLSPDAILNSCSLLLISLFVYGIVNKNSLTKRYMLLVMAIVAVLSLTKQSYFILGFLFLFLPPTRSFGSLKRYFIWNSALIIVSLALTLGWYMIIRDISHNIHIAHKPNQFISSSDQIDHILNNPITYAGLLGEQILLKINPQYTQLAGSLTWKAILIPQPVIFFVYLGLLISLVLTYLEAPIKGAFNRVRKTIISVGPILLAFGSVLLIYTSLYLTFNEVGSTKRIEGVQGRYFIPLIALLIPLFVVKSPASGLASKTNTYVLRNMLIYIVLFQSIITFIAVLTTNYVPGIEFV